MSNFIVLAQRDANLLRQQILMVDNLRLELLTQYNPEIVHKLRGASRRLGETISYFDKALPVKWSKRLLQLSIEITKTLSRGRELEVNRKLANDFRLIGKANAIAAELLINLQQKNLIKWRKKAERTLNHKHFQQYAKFLSILKGSRTVKPLRSTVFQSRVREFLAFGWSVSINDKRLHDLRIRTKRLGLALEMQQRASRHNYGRLGARIRNLQELLGHIRDVLVFQRAVRRLRKHWSVPDLKLIPVTLDQLYENLQLESVSLYSRVYPLFSKIVPPLTFAIRPAKPIRSSTSIGVESRADSKLPMHRSTGRTKRSA